MLSLEDLQIISRRAEEQREWLRTEESIKTALALPFIDALGYDRDNPSEVAAEFAEDDAPATTKSEKVDYAILRGGKPIILVECKALGNPLGASEITQLAKYYNSSDATVGILTNGVVYKFFSDLAKTNIMDQAPFWEMDIRSADEGVVVRLRQFAKDKFDAEKIKKAAIETNIITGAKANLEKMYAAPDDEFSRVILRNVDAGNLAGAFPAELVKRAFHQFVSDHSNTESSDKFPKDPIPDEPQSDPDDTPIPSSPPRVEPTGEWQALSNVQPRQGAVKPAYIMLPDNKLERITAWNQVTLHTFRWLTENDHLNATHCPIQRRSRYIVATQPIHPTGRKFKLAREVKSLHVELSYSIPDTIKIAQIIIERAGMDASQFKLRW